MEHFDFSGFWMHYKRILGLCKLLRTSKELFDALNQCSDPHEALNAIIRQISDQHPNYFIQNAQTVMQFKVTHIDFV